METYNTQIPTSLDYFKGVFADLLLLFPSNVNELNDDLRWLTDYLFSEGDDVVIPALATLGKAFERALITGEVFSWDRSVFEARERGLPKFLGSLFERVLHEDGSPIFHYNAIKASYCDVEGDTFLMPLSILRSCADPIVCIRQVCLFYSKVEDLPVLASEDEEIRAFVTRVTVGKPVALRHRTGILHDARKALRGVLMQNGDIHPSLAQWIDNPFGAHGPGAVFDGSRGKDKWRFSGYLSVDERLFDSQYAGYSLADPNDLACTDTLKSRLSVVPKDFRGHRLICIECKEAMFAQQGLWKVLESIIAQDASVGDCIDFRDQAKSFRMSRQIDRYSTIDLKDASDGISLELAKLLLPREVFALLTRYRARTIILPDGEEVSNIRTLFTMGNALCFPVQSLIFWALGAGVLQRIGGYSLDDLRGRLRVFGDDIIIESKFATELCSVLSESGLTVNYQKYCHHTPVRESCGSWYYGSVDARITKVRVLRPQQLRDWVSVVATSRLLFSRGFENAALALLRRIEGIYPVPYGILGLPGQWDRKKNTVRYNVQLQRMEVCVPVLHPEARFSHLEGFVGLYSYFTNHGSRTVDHGDDLIVDWSWECVE